MAKIINRVAKIEFMAGQAKPGPELASLGINMPQFCSQFNDATKDRAGDVVPVIIKAYNDKSFDFVLKTTPASIMLKRAAKIEKGSPTQKTEKVGEITKEQLEEIAKYKFEDLNANTIESAMKIIAGSARSMGITIKDYNEGEENEG